MSAQEGTPEAQPAAAANAPQPAPPKSPDPISRLVEALALKFRDPNPILVKELRATFRTNLFIRFLYLSVGVIGVIVLGGGAMVAAGPMPPAQVGQVVFQIFFSLILGVIALVAPAYASTSITSEREAQTYESLILSGMSAWRIVRGKFIAAYASMFLVLVAVGPVVGVAFLFGGISPGQVVFGFLGILLILAPAIALGVAVSARVGSTRIAILISTIVFFPVAMIGTGVIAGFGELAGREWALAMEGPFWWTEALTNYIADLRILGLLVALPLYFFLMPVWLFLASAVAGIRPAAEDRSTPFKWWSVVFVAGLVVLVTLVPLLAGTAKDTAVSSIVGAMMAGGGLSFVALIFMNEPPLPPRLFAQRMRASRLGFIGRAIGPGAAPTLRLAALLIVVTSFAMAALPALARHLYWPSWTEHGAADLGLLIQAAALSATTFFFLSFGVWLRVFLRNGLASRVLSIAALLAISIIPYLWTAVIDPNAFESMDETMPFFIEISPTGPFILAFGIALGEMSTSMALGAVVPVLLYTALGGVFWVLVEVRCAKVRRLDEQWRAERERRARTSDPTVTVMERGSRPSLASAIAQRNEAIAAKGPAPFPAGAGAAEVAAAREAAPHAAQEAAQETDQETDQETARVAEVAAEWQGSTEAFELTKKTDPERETVDDEEVQPVTMTGSESEMGSSTEAASAEGSKPASDLTSGTSDFGPDDEDAETAVEDREPEGDK